MSRAAGDSDFDAMQQNVQPPSTSIIRISRTGKSAVARTNKNSAEPRAGGESEEG